MEFNYCGTHIIMELFQVPDATIPLETYTFAMKKYSVILLVGGTH